MDAKRNPGYDWDEEPADQRASAFLRSTGYGNLYSTQHGGLYSTQHGGVYGTQNAPLSGVESSYAKTKPVNGKSLKRKARARARSRHQLWLTVAAATAITVGLAFVLFALIQAIQR